MTQKEIEERLCLARVRAALVEYRNTQNYFDNVTEPMLVDIAVYAMEAARLKYLYHLGEAQQMLKSQLK